jgi:hypothetical protein
MDEKSPFVALSGDETAASGRETGSPRDPMPTPDPPTNHGQTEIGPVRSLSSAVEAALTAEKGGKIGSRAFSGNDRSG